MNTYLEIIISEGNKMKDILLKLENKKIAICNDIDNIDIQISDFEQRKKYHEGRLFEVNDILETIKKGID